MVHHGMQDRQPLAPTGRQGDLVGFARGAQALRKGFEHRGVPHGDQRTHGQGSAHGGASAPDGAAAPQGAPVALAGGNSSQGGEALAAQRAQLRQIQDTRPGPHGPHARHTAGQRVARTPDRTGVSQGLSGGVERHQTLSEPEERGLAIRPQATGRTAEAVGRSRPQGATLAPPRHQGTQRFGLRLWPWARWGAHRLRQVGSGAGVAGSGCGQLPGGLGQVPSLTGVDDDAREGGGGPRSDHGPLGAPRGFEPNAPGLHSLEPHHEGGHPGGIVAHRPACTGRAHRTIALGFGDSKTNTYVEDRHNYS